MAKRKYGTSPAAGEGVGTSSRATLTPHRPSRHTYRNEEYRFIWYHKQTLKLSFKEIHRLFNKHFEPEIAVTVAGLSQVVDRIKRCKPDCVFSVVNTEYWAKADYLAQLRREREILDDELATDESGTEESSKKHHPSSLRHTYTNEQYRFIYFYRNELRMNLCQTHKFFNDYFGLSLSRSAVNQLLGRLKKTAATEIVDHVHTEPWAIGRPETIDLT